MLSSRTTASFPPRESIVRVLRGITPVVLTGLAVLLPVNSARNAFAREIDRRPNIVFILADDLGWSDTTLYGTTQFYRTPNIQRLARRGMTFTHAYAASPLCSPTRASILTGLNPARIGITAPVCHIKAVRLDAMVARRAPPTSKALGCQSATRLKTEYFTLAEALKQVGYATGHFGKWHLGPEPYDPLHQGFDVDLPHWPGPGPAGSYVAPWRFPNFKQRKPGEHIEDRMGDEAVTFIQQHKDVPFFLNYWQFSVHAPFDAKPGYVKKWRSRVDPNNPQRSPTYAAMVESLDDNVGKMLDTLDRLDLTDHTIIVFFSDNGGNMYNQVDGTTPTSNAPLRGGKATMYEGGTRVPCIVSWPGVTKHGARSDAVIQSTDFYPTILDMLNLHPKTGQTFDGISIVPALQGRPLSRKAIFTFFPHGPKVPEWLPPSVWTREGDWKLIRIFHDGNAGQHRYELYNLKEDVGERHNVASKYLDKVRHLDKLIDAFLLDTKAVVPLPNPNYDPASAALSKLGLTAMHDCKIALAAGTIHVTSLGNDPHFKLDVDKLAVSGSLTLEFRMKSAAHGSGQVFWHEKGAVPAFFRQRSVMFHPLHDGDFHSYRVSFTARNPIVAIRIDPAQSRGQMEFQSIRLLDDHGNRVQHWDFRTTASQAK